MAISPLPTMDDVRLDPTAYQSTALKKDAETANELLTKAMTREAPKAHTSFVGNTTLMSPVQLGEAARAKAAQVGDAATVNMDVGGFRDYQAELADDLTGAAKGVGPSAAQNTMQGGLATALRNQNAAAAGSRSPLGRLNAANAGVELQARAIGEGAQNRLREISDARSQLGTVVQNARGQDVGVAQGNQAIINEFGLKNAALNQEANLANQAAINQFGLTQAELFQDTNTKNAAAKNAATAQQAEIDSTTNLANLDAATKAQQQKDAMAQYGLSQRTATDTYLQQLAQQWTNNNAQIANNLNSQKISIWAAQNNLSMNQVNGWLAALGGVASGVAAGAGAMAASDRRVKHKVRSASAKDLDALLESAA